MLRSVADPVAVLDVGTSKTCLLVSDVREGLLRYAGHGLADSNGIRKGVVVNLDAAVDSIRQALEDAERISGHSIERVRMSITGAHVRGVASQAGIPLASRSREITREDTGRVLDLARTITIPDDREIIHVVPQEYVLDNQPGIHDPLGMLASRLEARVYIVTVSAGARQNLIVAANRAGLEVEEVVFSPYAASEPILRAEDRQMGVAVLDMGAGSTGIVAYVQGVVCHASVIPIGGDHFTNDIAIACNTPVKEAEKIKRSFGFAAANYVHEGNSIEVPGVGDRPARMMSHRKLCECIESRAQELIRLVQEDLRKSGVLHALASGIMLTGGGSRLAGFQELMETLLGLPVRMGAAALIEGMPDELADPEFAFVLGATYYSHRMDARRPRSKNIWDKLMTRVTARA